MVATLAAAGVTVHRYEGMGQDELGIWRAPSGDRVELISPRTKCRRYKSGRYCSRHCGN
jgi:hypothetical protein